MNGKEISVCALNPGDVISLNGLEVTLEPTTRNQEAYQTTLRTRAGYLPGLGLLLLSLIQVLMCVQLLFASEPEHLSSIALGFGGLLITQWRYSCFTGFIRLQQL